MSAATLNTAKKIWRWFWMIPMLPIALIAILISLIGNGKSHTLELLKDKGFWKDYRDGN